MLKGFNPSCNLDIIYLKYKTRFKLIGVWVKKKSLTDKILFEIRLNLKPSKQLEALCNQTRPIRT